MQVAAMRVLVLALLAATASALQMSHLRPLRGVAKTAPRWLCSETGGKGFGAAPAPPPPSKKKKKKKVVAPPPVAANVPRASPTENLEAVEARGRAMLEEMRKSSGETPDYLQKKGGGNTPMQLTEEELRPLEPEEQLMPEAVADRMLPRIVASAGIPIVLAVFVFIGFWFANTQLQMDLPPTIVAYATQALLLLSFAGITFGVMSTNLDEDADQSLLGTENLQRNIDVMRGAQNARISEAELDQEERDALADGVILSQAAAAKQKRNEMRD